MTKFVVKAKKQWSSAARAIVWGAVHHAVDVFYLHDQKIIVKLIGDQDEKSYGYASKVGNRYFVHLCCPYLPAEAIVNIVFHEFTHVQQKRSGRLIDVDNVNYWNCKAFPEPQSFEEYWNLPWEIEAREVAEKLTMEYLCLT